MEVGAWRTPRKGHHKARSAISSKYKLSGFNIWTEHTGFSEAENCLDFDKTPILTEQETSRCRECRFYFSARLRAFSKWGGKKKMGQKFFLSERKKKWYAPTHKHTYRSYIFICLHICVPQFQHNFLMLSLNWRSGALVHYSYEGKKKRRKKRASCHWVPSAFYRILALHSRCQTAFEHPKSHLRAHKE